jgi:hypothetical protein
MYPYYSSILYRHSNLDANALGALLLRHASQAQLIHRLVRPRPRLPLEALEDHALAALLRREVRAKRMHVLKELPRVVQERNVQPEAAVPPVLGAPRRFTRLRWARVVRGPRAVLEDVAPARRAHEVRVFVGVERVLGEQPRRGLVRCGPVRLEERVPPAGVHPERAVLRGADQRTAEKHEQRARTPRHIEHAQSVILTSSSGLQRTAKVTALQWQLPTYVRVSCV